MHINHICFITIYIWINMKNKWVDILVQCCRDIHVAAQYQYLWSKNHTMRVAYGTNEICIRHNYSAEFTKYTVKFYCNDILLTSKSFYTETRMWHEWNIIYLAAARRVISQQPDEKSYMAATRRVILRLPEESYGNRQESYKRQSEITTSWI